MAILKRSLEQPIRQIAYNAGEDASVIAQKVKEQTGSYGYNARTGEFSDLLESGIVDPTKVVRTTLQNAASASAMFLTTEAIVAETPEEEGGDENAAAAGGGMPGMGGMGM